MIYLYQPMGLTAPQWHCLHEAVQEAGDALVLWDARHYEQVVSELVETSVPLSDTEKPDLLEEPGEQANALFLLMDLPGERLDHFLKSLREKECRFTLKAILTQHNRSWTLSHLIQDVADEAKLIGSMMQLRQLVRASDDFPREDYAPEKWAAFQAVREETVAFLQQVGKRDVSATEMELQKMRFNQAALTLMQKEEKP